LKTLEEIKEIVHKVYPELKKKYALTRIGFAVLMFVMSRKKRAIFSG
jgi:hypothetical protein